MIVHLSKFFICDAPLAGTSGNIFAVVGNFIAFQGCDGLPSFFGWILFVFFSLPWLMWIATLLYSNVATGVVTTAVALIAALVGFFT